METDPYGQSEAERRHHVERAFAAVAERGGVVSPWTRQLYGRYVAGELSLRQVRELADARAAAVLARTRAACGWVG